MAREYEKGTYGMSKQEGDTNSNEKEKRLINVVVK
jgi:hypothetical protein